MSVILLITSLSLTSREKLLIFSYYRVIFLENWMPTLNNLSKEKKKKTSMVKID